MTDGGGASRPLAQPMRTMNSHASRQRDRQHKPKRRPRQARPVVWRRPLRLCGGAFGGNGHAHKQTWWPTQMQCVDCSSFAQGDPTACRVDDAAGLPGQPGNDGYSRRHIAIVDQIVERLLHVDIGRDHAGLLQRQAGLQDGVALLAARCGCRSDRCAP